MADETAPVTKEEPQPQPAPEADPKPAVPSPEIAAVKPPSKPKLDPDGGNLAEVFDEKIRQRGGRPPATDKKPEAPSAETPKKEIAHAPTASTSTEPPDWYTEGMDTKHGFLKGKKGDEVEKVVRTLEANARSRATYVSQLEARIERLLAGQEPVPARQQQQPPAPQQAAPPNQGDELAELEDLFYTNHKEWLRRSEERQSRLIRQVLTEERQHGESVTLANAIKTAGDEAVRRVMADYEFDEATAQRVMFPIALYVKELAEQSRASGDMSTLRDWMKVDTFIQTLENFNPTLKKAQPVVTAPIVQPERPAPPGRTNPAPPAPRAPAAPALSAQNEQIANMLAEAAGVSKERLPHVKQRIAARTA